MLWPQFNSALMTWFCLTSKRDPCCFSNGNTLLPWRSAVTQWGFKLRSCFLLFSVLATEVQIRVNGSCCIQHVERKQRLTDSFSRLVASSTLPLVFDILFRDQVYLLVDSKHYLRVQYLKTTISQKADGKSSHCVLKQKYRYVCKKYSGKSISTDWNSFTFIKVTKVENLNHEICV